MSSNERQTEKDANTTQTSKQHAESKHDKSEVDESEVDVGKDIIILPGWRFGNIIGGGRILPGSPSAPPPDDTAEAIEAAEPWPEPTGRRR